jgi:hypothetical protein
MNLLVKHSILQHLHHVVYSKIKNQYHIQAVVTEGPNGKWTSTDFLGFVSITVTTLLCKQINKSGKASTLAAQLQETFLSIVVP